MLEHRLKLAARLAPLLGTLLIATGCSHAPTTADQAPATLSVAEPITLTEDAYPSIEFPAGWPAMSPAAAAIAESDLFNRIRGGFALTDVDHRSVDLEVSWYARHPDYLDRTLRRGERYLYYIVNELEARGMPMELALLPVVESAFNPVALSRARASGLWQFIPATGKRYGLKQNFYYDGRRDVIESTRAALDYLQFLANEFNGDWLLAVAAYNTGEANVARKIARNQAKGKPTDFFSLDLPRETRAYVPKLLAMRRIVADPAAYGLEFGRIGNQPYFVKIDVGGQIDLNVAAELAGMPKDDFVALNPGHNRWVTDPDGPFHLLVPVEHEERFLAGLAELTPDKRVPVVYYRVRKGDTLGAIARKHGLSVDEVRATNRLKGTQIHPGQELLMAVNPRVIQARQTEPARTASIESSAATATGARTASTHTVRRGETLWSIARSHGMATHALAVHNSLDDSQTLSIGQKLSIPATATLASTNAAELNVQRLTYTVRRGDTLSGIARMFRVDVGELLGWNKLRSANSIKAGQRLVMYVDDSHRSGG